MLDFLKPKFNSDLIRLGSNNDGGYLIERNSYYNSKLLLSFGIFNNWDFEKDFNKKMIAIDDQVDLKFVLKWFFRRRIKLLSLIFYLKNKKSFKKGFVGKSPFKFDEIINSLPIDKHIFLKIDIEGSEYNILNDIIFYENKFLGIIIEFHEVEKHIKQIRKFVKNLSLSLVHVHVNNFGDISKNGVPNVIEITFSKFHTNETFNMNIPNDLDSPNDKSSEEILINFK